MSNTNTKRLLFCGYHFHIHAAPEPLPYALVPNKPSWAELNRGKQSKKQRRK